MDFIEVTVNNFKQRVRVMRSRVTMAGGPLAEARFSSDLYLLQDVPGLTFHSYDAIKQRFANDAEQQKAAYGNAVMTLPDGSGTESVDSFATWAREQVMAILRTMPVPYQIAKRWGLNGSIADNLARIPVNSDGFEDVTSSLGSSAGQTIIPTTTVPPISTAPISGPVKLPGDPSFTPGMPYPGPAPFAPAQPISTAVSTVSSAPGTGSSQPSGAVAGDDSKKDKVLVGAAILIALGILAHSKGWI